MKHLAWLLLAIAIFEVVGVYTALPTISTIIHATRHLWPVTLIVVVGLLYLAWHLLVDGG